MPRTTCARCAVQISEDKEANERSGWYCLRCRFSNFRRRVWNEACAFFGESIGNQVNGLLYSGSIDRLIKEGNPEDSLPVVPPPQPDQRTCSNLEPKAPCGKTSWKNGQIEFICTKCKHTKRKLRYVQPIGEAGRVRHDTTDGGCGPKCFKGEHLHVICCDCGYREWDYCADHVEQEEKS